MAKLKRKISGVIMKQQTRQQLKKMMWACKIPLPIYYWFYRKIYYIRYIPKRIRNFYQRGTRGYSDSDVPNLDWYLARVISKSLLDLIEYEQKWLLLAGKNRISRNKALYKIAKVLKKYCQGEYPLTESGQGKAIKEIDESLN